jgi:hypothetical protein
MVRFVPAMRISKPVDVSKGTTAADDVRRLGSPAAVPKLGLLFQS